MLEGTVDKREDLVDAIDHSLVCIPRISEFEYPYNEHVRVGSVRDERSPVELEIDGGHVNVDTRAEVEVDEAPMSDVVGLDVVEEVVADDRYPK